MGGGMAKIRTITLQPSETRRARHGHCKIDRLHRNLVTRELNSPVHSLRTSHVRVELQQGEFLLQQDEFLLQQGEFFTDVTCPCQALETRLHVHL